MSSHVIISMVGGDPMPTTEAQVTRAITQAWGPASVDVVPAVSDQLARTLRIHDADGRFIVDITREVGSVTANGTPAQNEKLACLVRGLLPSDAPRVIAFDGSWSWHAELVAGITPETFAAHVVEHDETWSDPELE